jgi:NAD(P)-dependent dehydrogenase (short-subunit alcohol dehydrogenase family)
MDATAEELSELGASQNEMDETIRFLEKLSRSNHSHAKFKTRSKKWERMMWSINTIASSITAGKHSDIKKKRQMKREYRRKHFAAYKSKRERTHILPNKKEDVESDASGTQGIELMPISDVTVKCYICKSRFLIKEHHNFYWSMCRLCGDFNYGKRNRIADLAGKVAIVTGARVKIGFQVTLKLLRANCFVIATTRFVADAHVRYSKQGDYASWKSRLLLARLELGDKHAIESFCSIIGSRFSRVDILINNAAQTIFRPREFYRDVLMIEAESDRRLDVEWLKCNEIMTTDRLLTTAYLDGPSNHLLTGANDDSEFPSGVVDIKNDNQQLDLRKHNSWTQTLETAPVEELLQDFVISCAAPFVLIQRLTKLMARQKGDAWSVIVNVSAVEGMFNVHNKSSRHPSSNIAKASFNMLTKTSGREYRNIHRIIMISVDTGLVTNEYPAGHPSADIPVPLDDIDGAARILDPVFSAMENDDVASGVLFKDYEITDW